MVPDRLAHAANLDPKQALRSMRESAVRDLLARAEDAYYNTGESILTDSAYDVLREAYPRALGEVGAPVQSTHAKTELPFWMGSMDKRQHPSKTAHPVVVSDKLDGVSCLLRYAEGRPLNMYTRGNGRVGRDISHCIRHVRIAAPDATAVSDKDPIFVRGELVLKRAVFERLAAPNGPLQGARNARNSVSGVLNAKDPDVRVLEEVDFVAYEVIRPANMRPSEQFAFMRDALRLLTAEHALRPAGVDRGALIRRLHARTNDGAYDVDGLIVARDEPYELVSEGNPKHAFAFKLDALEQDSVETRVREVRWRLSKDRRYKPTVEFEPFKLKGVTISRATGHNAQWIATKGIGAGAIVRVVRSGDVIPRIVTVVERAAVRFPDGDWVWKGVDLESREPRDEGADLTHTLVALRIPHLKEGTVRRIVEAGHTDLGKVLRLTKADLLKVEGFKPKSADNLATALAQRLREVRCIELMVASNTFGRGVAAKTLAAILAKFPFGTTEPSQEGLLAIRGIGEVAAKAYLDGLPRFREFLRKARLQDVCGNANETEGAKKADEADEGAPVPVADRRVFLFTGFRSKELQQRLEAMGHTIAATLSKKVDTVVYDGKENKKVSDARDRGVRVVTREAFERSVGRAD